ncbi:hypothetical protein B0J14DRAFT_645081 [Halenospora varia]|nr:hypothetical protein B0J14DRAFT_645081 [Halenospora varia]
MPSMMLLVFEATFTIFNRMRTLVALLALYVLPTLGYPVSEYKDQCKDLKKKAKALHSPRARSLASLFCNGYISIFVETVNTYKFTRTTDSAIGPITEYPYTFTTLPPGTLTDVWLILLSSYELNMLNLQTLTEYLEVITITTVCSLRRSFLPVYSQSSSTSPVRSPLVRL